MASPHLGGAVAMSQVRAPGHAFSLLGLKPMFLLDEALLEQNYLRAQLQAHPDFWPQALKSAENLSAALNGAYEQLKNPVTRSQCLLEWAGWWLVSQQDPALAQEMFLLQEQTQDGRLSPEAHKAYIQDTQQRFHGAFEAKDGPTSQQLYLRLAYLTKMAPARG